MVEDKRYGPFDELNDLRSRAMDHRQIEEDSLSGRFVPWWKQRREQTAKSFGNYLALEQRNREKAFTRTLNRSLGDTDSSISGYDTNLQDSSTLINQRVRKTVIPPNQIITSFASHFSLFPNIFVTRIGTHRR
ncbi:hypothetical protein WH47_09132 [Habropoda laboriosa]|uniref:Uncharacterized protein n=1 Tax=Habropoda laboriosa TaxID=597456 RepID=A0A0L7QN93_9HYME|nr:hypothetical protein WH47_09132 [Habropoda laboriosa]